MGKNRKKTNNIFKVAGAKSLKLKAKAKAVKTNLKHLNIKNREKVAEIDKAFAKLEDKIRGINIPEKKEVAQNVKSKLPTVNNEKFVETQKISEETM